MSIITPESLKEELREKIRFLETGLEKVSGLKTRLIQLIRETDNSELLSDAECCYDDMLVTEKTNGFMRHEIRQWLNKFGSADHQEYDMGDSETSMIDKIIQELCKMDDIQQKISSALDGLWERHFNLAS
jgi:hypothetical protein